MLNYEVVKLLILALSPRRDLFLITIKLTREATKTPILHFATSQP